MANSVNTGAAAHTSNVAGDLMALKDYEPSMYGFAGSPGKIKYFP